MRFKGMVSRYWERLQIGLLDRSEFHTIPLEVYFQIEIHFNLELFQNRVCPGVL
jgi:hypothetical protein